MSLDKIKVGHSPLTNRINVYRLGKDPKFALESRDATREVMGSVVEHLMHDAPKGARTVVTEHNSGDKWTLLCMPGDQDPHADIKFLKAKIQSALSCHPNAVETLLREALEGRPCA